MHAQRQRKLSALGTRACNKKRNRSAKLILPKYALVQPTAHVQRAEIQGHSNDYTITDRNAGECRAEPIEILTRIQKNNITNYYDRIIIELNQEIISAKRQKEQNAKLISYNQRALRILNSKFLLMLKHSQKELKRKRILAMLL